MTTATVDTKRPAATAKKPLTTIDPSITARFKIGSRDLLQLLEPIGNGMGGVAKLQESYFIISISDSGLAYVMRPLVDQGAITAFALVETELDDYTPGKMVVNGELLLRILRAARSTKADSGDVALRALERGSELLTETGRYTFNTPHWDMLGGNFTPTPLQSVHTRVTLDAKWVHAFLRGSKWVAAKDSHALDAQRSQVRLHFASDHVKLWASNAGCMSVAESRGMGSMEMVGCTDLAVKRGLFKVLRPDLGGTLHIEADDRQVRLVLGDRRIIMSQNRFYIREYPEEGMAGLDANLDSGLQLTVDKPLASAIRSMRGNVIARLNKRQRIWEGCSSKYISKVAVTGGTGRVELLERPCKAMLLEGAQISVSSISLRARVNGISHYAGHIKPASLRLEAAEISHTALSADRPVEPPKPKPMPDAASIAKPKVETIAPKPARKPVSIKTAGASFNITPYWEIA